MSDIKETNNIETNNIEVNNKETEMNSAKVDDKAINNQDAENADKVKKELKVTVNMNAKLLYDYLVHHAYSSAACILSTCIGALGIIVFANNPGADKALYLILGAILVFYTPISLKLQSAKLMQFNETFKKPLDYTLNSEGITVSQGEESQTIGWDKCLKVVSTRQSIVLYTGKRNASIFPRRQLGDKLPALISVMAENMEPKKIRVRY